MQEWPDGLDQLVQQIQVAALQRPDGQRVALLRLVDELGDHRDIEVSERAAWEALVGFLHFLRQVHGGTPCLSCGAPQGDHAYKH